MSVTRRIAILTLSVGSGHTSAAKVIQRALNDGEEEVDARVLDVVELAQPWFRLLYVDSYFWVLRRAPWLWRWLFERRDAKQHQSTAPNWAFRRGCRRVLEQLRSFAPHLVIANEVAAVEISALGKREGWFNAPILAVHTDFHSEPPWMQQEVDFYCVASEEAKSQLIGWGLSANRVLVSGIPIDSAFSLPYDKTQIVRSMGLVEGRPVILVTGGGMGPMPLDRIVESLELCRLPVQVIAVAGHDREMKERLERLRGKVAIELRVLGWAESMPELMAAADLLLTKPGGLTTAEALAAGLPMLLTHPIPGPEERHVDYLVRHKLARVADRLEMIPKIAFEMLSRPHEREELAGRAREAARPDAVYAVAHVARALLERATYIDLLSTPPATPGEDAYLM